MRYLIALLLLTSACGNIKDLMPKVYRCDYFVDNLRVFWTDMTFDSLEEAKQDAKIRSERLRFTTYACHSMIN